MNLSKEQTKICGKVADSILEEIVESLPDRVSDSFDTEDLDFDKVVELADEITRQIVIKIKNGDLQA